jgi:hypothetical protein
MTGAAKKPEFVGRVPAASESGMRMTEYVRSPATALRDVRDGRPDILIRELLSRFEAGDYLGALAASDAVLDSAGVLLPTPAAIGGRRARAMSPSAAQILVLADRRATLEEVVSASGLPMLDALRTVCELMEAGLLKIQDRPIG